MSQTRSVFRPGAVERYAQATAQAVLPRFIKPRALIFLWLLFGLLAAGLMVLWLARVPIYVVGSALVVERSDAGLPTLGADGREPAVVLFLPSEMQGRLADDQPLFLRFSMFGDEQVEERLVAYDRQVSSPEAVGQRFRLTNVGLIITQPVLVSTTRFVHNHHGPQTPQELDHSKYIGAVGQVYLPVGSRSVLSFVPVVGGLLGEDKE